jgi:hypothetical protein
MSKTNPGVEPDADDLAWAREDLGEGATDDEAYEVAARRARERAAEDQIKLVCPVCGSGDDLVSWEMESTGHFGTRFFQNPDDPNEPEIDYDSADPRAGEGGSGFVDDVQCNNHGPMVLELSASDLVPDGTPPNPQWKPPTKPRPNATSQQEELVEAANHLAEVINRVVPPSTVPPAIILTNVGHYAIEQLRAPLKVLRDLAPGVITGDYIREGEQ